MHEIWIIWWTSHESTTHYYDRINKLYNEKVWWKEYPEFMVKSVNFWDIIKLLDQDDWDWVFKLINNKAYWLERNYWIKGIMIATNTLHKVADKVQENLMIPLINIIEETWKVIHEDDSKKVWLLWTKFTMKDWFYQEKLQKKFWIDTVTPTWRDLAEVNRIIREELVNWKVLDSSIKTYQEIMDTLVSKWADWIILGCTEIPMLVNKENYTKVPLYDTTEIHCNAAVRFMIEGK